MGTTFVVSGRQQKIWHPEKGEYEPIPPYDSSRSPNGTVFGVRITGGVGETDDPLKAVDLADSGYIVTPDPHPAAQEVILAELAIKKDASEENLREYERFIMRSNKWRAANKVPLIDPAERAAAAKHKT